MRQHQARNARVKEQGQNGQHKKLSVLSVFLCDNKNIGNGRKVRAAYTDGSSYLRHTLALNESIRDASG